MPGFYTAEQYYIILKSLFTRLETEAPTSSQKVSQSKLIMRMRTTQPTTEVTINGRHNPVQISYGPSPVRPDIELELPAELLHQILLGQINLKAAVGTGKFKFRGPVWKAFVMEDIFRAGQGIYPEVLQAHGVPPS